MGRIPVIGLLALSLGMVMAACTAVVIQHPAGEPVADEVGKQVEGWWVLHGQKEDEVQCYFVQSLKDGAIRVATLGLDPNSNKLEFKEGRGLLTQFEGAVYLHLASGEPEPDQLSGYFLLRMHMEDGPAMVLWVARGSAFADAVRNGELTREAGRMMWGLRHRRQSWRHS